MKESRPKDPVDETEALSPIYQSPTQKIGDNEAAVFSGGLKPRITLFGGIMVIVGCIIGGGIFISPKGVHRGAGSVGLSLIIWIFCGVFSGIGAYCYAELGTFITESGGDYAYIYASFGGLVAFLRMWIECIIVRPCTMTAVAMTFAVYTLRAIVSGPPPAHTVQLLAAGCLILLTLVNVLSVRLVTWVQNVFTVAKLFALVLIILTGVVLLCIGGPYHEPFKDAFAGSKWGPGDLAMAFYSGLWAYDGWNSLNFVTEELENPRRNLPIAIAVSMVLCTAVNTLANIAFYAGLGPQVLLESPAVAITFAERFYRPIQVIMPIFVAFSCFGTVNGVLLTSSRLFYVAGRRDHMPLLLNMINTKYQTPLPAVLFTGLLSLFYLVLNFFINDIIYTLIVHLQIVNWLVIGVAIAGLLYLRRKMPPRTHPRPLVCLVWPIIFLVGCIFLVVFPMVAEPVDTFFGLRTAIFCVLTGVLVYFLFVYWQNKPAPVLRAFASATYALQKLFMVYPEGKKAA